MKILTIKIFIIAAMLMITSSLRNSNTTLPQVKLAKNQLSPFPNTYEAPVSKDQVPKSRYTPPRLAASLRELDPKKRLKKAEFLQWIHYANYKLTRGEAEIIYQFADKNKDDLLDVAEWESFVGLYVLPFEACDRKEDYLLDEVEFKECFYADPRSLSIQFKKKYLLGNNPTKYIIDMIESRGVSQINLAEYVFFRRSLYGWVNCHSTSKYISKSNFRCALLNAIPQKFQMKLDSDKVYEAGILYGNDKNLIQLDFVSYLRVLHYYHQFSSFGYPMSLPYLEKSQFLRAVHEDRLPNNWEDAEIELIYYLTNDGKYLDFSSFCFFYNLHRLFNKYSIITPLKIHRSELLLLLRDYETPLFVPELLDNSFTNFSEPEYQEASLVLGRKRANEKGFFFRFKQDASLTTNGTALNLTLVYNNTLDVEGNVENRNMFFSIFCGSNRDVWTKKHYYRAFLLSNFFYQMGVSSIALLAEKKFTLNVGFLAEKMQNYYETTIPSINTDQRRNHNFYKNMPKELELDLITFLDIENFLYKIDDIKSGKDNILSETNLKIILRDLGMENMPDTVIDLAKKGYDSVRRRIYNVMEVVKYSIIVQAAAAEIRRAKVNIQKYNIKQTTNSKRAILSPRRFLSSPMV